MHERNQIKTSGSLSAAGTFIKSRPAVLAAVVAIAVFGFVGVSYTAGDNRGRRSFAEETDKPSTDAAI